MTRTHRRILYLTFFGVFFVVAPLLLLFGAGYRLNLSTKTVYRTGLIVLASSPRPERIFLNGSPVSTTTNPVRIHDLRPGTYTVRLERTGFHSWERAMVVRPGAATTIEDIRLFTDEQPTVVAEDIARMFPAPNQQDLALLSSSGHQLFLSSNGTGTLSTLLEEDAQTMTDVRWAPSGERLVVVFDDASLGILNLLQPGATTLRIPQHEPINRLAWEGSNLLLLQGTDLLSINGLTGDERLLAQHLLDVTVIGSTRYVLAEGDGTVIIATQREDAAPTPVQTVTATPGTRFLPSPARGLSLLDGGKDTLIVLDGTKRDSTPRTFPHVSLARWSDNGNLLAYGNDFELSVYDRTTDIATLVNRSSNPFLNWWWYDDTGYLFVSQRDGLQAVETFTESPIQFTGLVEDRITDLMTRRTGAALSLLTGTTLIQLDIQ